MALLAFASSGRRAAALALAAETLLARGRPCAGCAVVLLTDGKPERSVAPTAQAQATTIARLRRALGDDARNPRFIATIPKRGYSLLPRPIDVIDVAARPGGAVIFDGTAGAASRPPVLPYSQNALRFEYALPRFDAYRDNRYQSRLVGLDQTWSDWSAESYRDFTSL